MAIVGDGDNSEGEAVGAKGRIGRGCEEVVASEVLLYSVVQSLGSKPCAKAKAAAMEYKA